MTRRRVGTSSAPTPPATGRKHRPDYKLVLFSGLLVLIGVVVLFAISPYQIHRLNETGGQVSESHYMLKQTLYLAAGAAAFVAAAMIPLDVWRRYAGRVVVAAILICAMLALLGAVHGPLAMCYNGACRWYDLGFLSFQPAELLKFGLLLYAAVFLGRRMQQNTVNSYSDTLLPIGLLVGIAALIVIGFQKDMGTGITIIGMLATMLFVAGLRYRLIVISGLIGLVIGIVFIVASPHRVARITTFVSSSNSPTDAASYHIDMATLAIGSGGIVGRGLGNGVQAFGYLPEALNDSIFAVLGETFGFIGLLVILGLFSALLKRLLDMIDRLSDPTMRLLVAGTFGWLATHVIVNIGAMTGLLPLTGVTLPFLSFGGTSLLFMMLALGMVNHISQYTSHQMHERGHSDESSRSGRRLRGPRHTGSRSY